MISKDPIYTVAIIGAGRIGASFDTPQSEHVLTHAHAFTENSRTKLVALVDSNVMKSQEQAKMWNTVSFTEVGEMFRTAHPDIVVIASPDDTHTELLIEAIHCKP